MRLVRSPVVVAAKPVLKSRVQHRYGGVLLEVDFLVFHAAPKPLDEHVVHPAALAVHADFHSQFSQAPGPFRRGELTSLIGVENLRNTPGGTHRTLQSLQAQIGSHGVGKRPAQHLARVPVHHRAQIGVAARHRHISDVGTPHLVGPVDGQIPQ